eukprot:2660825-Alexandrium_andersonii.AAC.1
MPGRPFANRDRLPRCVPPLRIYGGSRGRSPRLLAGTRPLGEALAVASGCARRRCLPCRSPAQPWQSHRLPPVGTPRPRARAASRWWFLRPSSHRPR